MLFSHPFPGQSRAVANRARRRSAESQMEVLESRSLMSVSIGSDGFTDVGPSGDSKIIYVSSSSGSDSNNGSQGAPVKSISKGISMMRSGSPDHLLLKRGDSWTERISWGKSGRSSQEPALLGAYGSGARPMIKAGSGTAIDVSAGNVNNVVFQGIHLFANTRDPNAPGFSRNEGGYGIRWVAGTTGALVEDCVIDQFRLNMTFEAYNAPQSNVKLRRNVITDAYNIGGGHSSGAFIQGVNGLTLEENVFDHNGWNSQVSGGGATAQNHNAYLSEKNNNVVVRGNVFADASSHGLQTRAGGVVEDNLFIRNPIGMSFGLVNGAALKAGGVTGKVDGNVFLESRTIGSGTRGWAIDLGNIKSATVSDNIFNDGAPGTMGAIAISPGGNLENASQGVGVNNLTIEDNVVHDWYMALEISGSMKSGGSGTTAMNNLVVRDNDFQNVTGTYNRIVAHPSSMSTSAEHWSNNRYYDSASSNGWFFIGSNSQSLATWKSKMEPTAQSSKVSFSNPNAGIDGFAGSYANFISNARKQSSSNWNGGPASGAVSFVRKGFNKTGSTSPTPTPTTPPAVENPPPTGGTPQISAADAQVAEGNSGTRQLVIPVTLSPASTRTVTVRYATGNKTAGEGDYGVTGGTVTFAPGQTSKSIAITVKGDTKVESSETFAVNLSGASGATVSDAQAIGTIVNDDGAVSDSGSQTPPPASSGDTTGPTVLSRSATGYSLKIRFSEDVSASLTAKDLTLRHTTRGYVVSDSLKLTYNHTTNEATWTWSSVGKLASGTWQATLPDQLVADAAGNRLAGGKDFSFTFGV